MGIRLSILLPFICLLFIGCDKRPKDVLSDDEMVKLITDMEIAEIYIHDNTQTMYNDSMRDKTMQYILDKRGIDKAKFDSTMTWYGKNIDIYRDLYAKVDAELTRRQNIALGEDVGETMKPGTDLWPYSSHLLISDLGNINALVFSFTSDQIEKGDRLNFRAKTFGLKSGSALLGVDYDNGMSAYSYTNQNGNDRVDISIQIDTAKNVKRIFGYVRSKDVKQMPIWLDSIALERMPFDSTQYYRIYSQRKGYEPKKREIIKPDTVKQDEEDAKMNSILENDGGLNIEDRPIKTKHSPIKRANTSIQETKPLKNREIRRISSN